ncbi:hypothetical protein [Geoglobus sp.]
MRIIRSINNHAVSPVLGLVLAFAIIVGGIGVVQQFFVPVWLKNEESMHYFKIKGEFERIHEKVLEAMNFGEAAVTLNPVLVYPDYPMLVTPETTVTTIEIRNIGTVEITVNGNTSTHNLTAMEMEPSYYYLKPSGEVYIGGEYFVIGSDSESHRISDRFISDGGEVRIVIMDIQPSTISSTKTLQLKGAKSSIVENFTLKITVSDPAYEWYLDYIENVFTNTSSATAVTRTASSVEVEFSNTQLLVGFVGSRSKDDYIKSVQEVLGGVPGVLSIINGSGVLGTITPSSGVQEIEVGESLFSIGTNNRKYLISTPIYITGFTGYSLTPADISVRYTYEDGSEVTVNTTWYTLENGYLQFPLTIPMATIEEKGGGHWKTITETPQEIYITINIGNTTYRAKLEI